MNNNIKAIFLTLSASFFAVLMEALIRAAQYDSNVFTIGFLRFFFGLLIIFPYLVKNKFTTYKTGNLKYWPSFVSMIKDKTPFKKGAKGDKGSVIIGFKTAGQQKKLVAAMSKITTGREVIGFLNERNAEMPVVGGGKVKITELWKENVKESKASTVTKIGGRDTEVYSEILVQFCLAYRLIYGKRATHADISNGDDYKPDILKAIRRRSFTGGKHSLTSKVVRKNLKQFSSQEIGNCALLLHQHMDYIYVNLKYKLKNIRIEYYFLNHKIVFS